MHKLSERLASCLFGVSRGAMRYEAKPRGESLVEAALRELAQKHRRWGFKLMLDRLRLVVTARITSE